MQKAPAEVELVYGMSEAAVNKGFWKELSFSLLYGIASLL